MISELPFISVFISLPTLSDLSLSLSLSLVLLSKEVAVTVQECVIN